MEKTKVFGIGLSKTGTSSLAQALQRLGFKTKDCMGATRYVAGDLSSIDMETVLAHDALTDTPIPSFYRQLDARFPGSKFILTVRDREGWLKSCRKQFSERFGATQNEAHKRIFEDLYGTNVFDEPRFVGGYERFVSGVLDYFKDRPQDLLVMDIAAGDGWEELCPFLGRAVPDTPFPKANVTQIRWMNIDDLVAIAEAAGLELLRRYKGEVEPAGRDMGGGRSEAVIGILDRAMQAALGRDAAEAAARSAQKTIAAGLKKLVPDIPVLSPLDALPDDGERKHWNHLWLVNPLHGRGAFAAGDGNFSVDVALIEDGRPICGVVHAPAKGITYLGRTGKGAFRRIVGGETVALCHARGADVAPTSSHPGSSVGHAVGNGSVALALCAVLENRAGEVLGHGPARECDVAAADAVLRAVGLCVHAGAAGPELTYDTAGLMTTELAVKEIPPAC